MIKEKKTIMRKIILFLLIAGLILNLVGCTQEAVVAGENEDLLETNWESILEEAEGTEVNFYGWGGSQMTNDWLDNFLALRLKEEYNITLNRVPMDIDQVLNKLLGENQMNVTGTADVIWINGENFSTARTNDLLYGPFTHKLPNFNQYIDVESVEVKYDFGFPVEGYEAPYGKAQFVLVYDEARVEQVPKGHEELMELVKNNAGKFTYPAPPDFTGSAFIRNIIYDIVGYEQFITMKADKEVIAKAIQPAMDYLNELKPYLWRNGETYPSTIAQLHNMYADHEVFMTMNYNSNEAAARIQTGEFPRTTNTFVFENGTIGNTHFLAIPDNAPNKAGALAVIDFILSVEAQASKYNPDNWGDLPVLDNARLSDSERAIFDEIQIGKGALPQHILLDHRVPEMPANFVPIIEEIWMENIL
ncbi:putative spermidine/putrescine transport system substrate-binding protein [Anaerovirgula multivorans]|uniref:Putative spermidine/putrescine transport system substrate-binding protein n=1 Tax=Anaerovirgula multivorans TaxID=312168 RepID=A0A239HQY3_9FIRM|nr:ABC transporter substrate-binding protein [Anaerovirgula multivorans]SNS83690.1 putative spermidine/putrescine transport system substrate-binding protein [Anaerovirgula multivorans]